MRHSILIVVLAGFLSVVPSDARPAAQPQNPPASPGDYPSLEAARDTVAAIIAHAVDLADTTVHMTQGPVFFQYWYADSWVDGWAFHVTVKDTTGCPNNLVENALLQRGWVSKYDYMADGPDGSIVGVVTPSYLCVIEGSWDGGDDADDSYVPEPGCEVTVTVVPRRADDEIKQ